MRTSAAQRRSEPEERPVVHDGHGGRRQVEWIRRQVVPRLSGVVEQAAKLTFEIDYLAPWLPVELDETATRELVRAAIAELGVDDVKQAGRVMGHIMKGGADLDGGLVNRLVREELGA